MTSRTRWGYGFAVGSAICWGVSGTFAQFLFEKRAVDPEWLVTARMLSAGSLLLIYRYLRGDRELFRIWGTRATALRLIAFGIFGMLGVQYTYFAAIQASNAATATVLQYLGPVFIAAYYAWARRQIPRPLEGLAIALAVAGTFLLVTHGSTSSLAISGAALFWGLTSALALSFYSIQPVSLLTNYSPSSVVGWGMLIGGVALSFIHPPWRYSGQWDGEAFFSAGFIILFGSLLAFYAYLTAVRWIGATTASLLACAEPLSAALVAVVWLGVSFGVYDWVGTAFIIGTILILSLHAKPTPAAP